MFKSIRQISYLFCITVLRIPLWFCIWFLGQFGLFKTIFLIYPTDEIESSAYCPDSDWIKKFFSARPSPGGLICNRFKPIGFYLFIPDTAQHLALRKNKYKAELILKRLLWIKKLANAETIGLAGQLGPVFSQRHKIEITHPFYSSTSGNIFSIQEAMSWIGSMTNNFSKRQNVTILGGGELGETLSTFLSNQGHQAFVAQIQYKRRGGVTVKDLHNDNPVFSKADIVINLLTKGEEFIESGVPAILPKHASIIDFSRPAIPPEAIPQAVFSGNRVRCPGMRFMLALPGGWNQKQLPACALPALLAARGKEVQVSIERFCLIARQSAFTTALIDHPETSFSGSFLQRINEQKVQALKVS